MKSIFEISAAQIVLCVRSEHCALGLFSSSKTVIRMKTALMFLAFGVSLLMFLTFGVSMLDDFQEYLQKILSNKTALVDDLVVGITAFLTLTDATEGIFKYSHPLSAKFGPISLGTRPTCVDFSG